MTFDEFIKKYLGKKIDWDNAYQGQCVDLFRQYVNDVLGLKQPKGVVGAKDFWTNYETDPILKDNFEKISNTPTGVPQKGDVVIWDAWTGNKYGHVAVFIEGDANKFVSLDQNYPTLSVVTKTEHNYTKPKVLGWLRPKVISPEQPMNFLDINADIPTWAEAELGLKAYEWYNTKWSIADMVKYLDGTYKNLKATKQDMAKLENSFADERNQLEDRVMDLEEDVELHQQANSRLNAENDSLKKQIAVLEEENKLWNALKRAVSSLLRR